MVELIIERIVAEGSNVYGLDERQQAFYRERIAQRLPEFIKRHQATVQPIINDFLVYKIADQVPTTQKVASCARQMQPILREFIEGYNEIDREMRPLLRPEQRAKWARDHFGAALGWRLAEAKLQSFAEGKFTARDWRIPFPGPHQRAEEITGQAKAAGLDTTPPPEVLGNVVAGQGARPGQAVPSPGGQTGPGQNGTKQDSGQGNYVPLDKWQSCVRQFISRYGLDEGQKTSAMAILNESRRLAQSYEKRRGKELSELRQKVRTASGPSKARLAAELSELERPLQEMYTEFQTRLDNLLTASQRELTASKP